jgi:phosphoribosylformylglycinamidine cyclo-ligase
MLEVPMAEATYREAGVNVDEGDRLVELIKPVAARTHGPEVLGGLGGFGGLFALQPGRFKAPVLVAGTDGVGTKLKLAFGSGRHATVGIDLVAMSVNDVCVSGAEPLFFLDYYATSRLRAEEAAEVIRGVAEGCRIAGCALLGGETAELPGFYQPGEYDLAGFAVGIVERSEIIDGRRVEIGDCIVGLESSGLHSNGFSLTRRILDQAGRSLDQPVPELNGSPLLDVLLEPTRIYCRAVQTLKEAVDVRALAHITGSGLPGNLPRVLPDGTRAVLHRAAWARPAIFGLLQAWGSVSEAEMARTFNLGIGMCAVVPREDVATALDRLARLGQGAHLIGTIAAGVGEAEVVWADGRPEAV